MDARVTLNQTLTTVARQVLRPLVRVLLRNGMSFKAFAEIAKHVFVDVSLRELDIPGKKQTLSRVSILTGLSRKEVQQVVSRPQMAKEKSQERYNRAARVIAGWVRDRDFTDARGDPQALESDGTHGSFAQLVKRYGGDVPARAVLDELLRVGAIESLNDGRVRLLARAYVPRTSDREKLDILGSDVAHLIATIDHNLQHGDTDPRFQRKVMYDNLPREAIAAFRALSGEHAQRLLEELDRWLSAHDRDTNASVEGTGRRRAGVGIYYFEEDYDDAPKEIRHD